MAGRMRVEWRRLRPGELDHELVWLSLTVLAVFVGAAWLWLHLPMPRCSFQMLTGYPCLTCGTTRATLALWRGDLAAAWAFSPLALGGLLLLAVYNLYAAVVVLGRTARLRAAGLTPAVRRRVLWVVAGLLLVNWIYLLTR